MKRLSGICITIFFLMVQTAYSESVFPDGLIVKDGYEQGVGTPVGNIQLVQGTVLIVHAGEMHAYLAKKDLPLFKGDTIITREDGRVSLRLGDGSVLTLTTATKLVINESIYDPSKENRSAFVSMTIGKARFWIKKLEDFKYSDFKVKTQTAVVGVRGSDFIVEAGDDFTKVTALENTQLEVVSLTMPCEDAKKTAAGKCKVEPVTLTDFERAVVNENALPIRAQEIPPEEAERIRKEFTIKEDGQIAKKDSAASEREIYLVPKTDLVAPESLNQVLRIEAILPEEIRKSAEKSQTVFEEGENSARQEDSVIQQQQTASESRHEKVIREISELPGFPKAPNR